MTAAPVNEGTVRKVRAITQEAIRSKKIRQTPINRATCEVMLEMADENLEVDISEVELSMLVGVYLDLKLKEKDQKRDLKKMIADDAGVRAFWAGIKNVLRTTDPKLRRSSWLSAYHTWELGAIENQWWASPLGESLLSFVRREKMLAYGSQLLGTKQPRFLQ